MSTIDMKQALRSFINVIVEEKAKEIFELGQARNRITTTTN